MNPLVDVDTAAWQIAVYIGEIQTEYGTKFHSNICENDGLCCFFLSCMTASEKVEIRNANL